MVDGGWSQLYIGFWVPKNLPVIEIIIYAVIIHDSFTKISTQNQLEQYSSNIITAHVRTWHTCELISNALFSITNKFICY